MAIISSVLSLDVFLSQTNSSVSQNFFANWCIVDLFSISFSGYKLLNAKQIAANNFRVKRCLRMNRHSADEYTVIASEQLLNNWHE
jgi:hypothetical protein